MDSRPGRWSSRPRQPGARKRRSAVALAGLAVGLALMASGCPAPYAVPPVDGPGGKKCGVTSGWIWRATWWNFYERGESFAGCGLFEQATQDFRWAVERREADQRHARTYGMHFLDDYFPHRELGISLLELGNLDEAEKELGSSLGQEPSARAKFYLNEARRRRLKRQGAGPAPGPTIAVDGAESFATREPSVWLSGHALSERYVESIEVNGKKQLIELAEADQTFRFEVPVDLGENTARIVAVDLLGNRNETVVRITGDRVGPVVAVQDIREISGGKLEITGSVHDTSGIASLRIGDVESPQNLATAAPIRLQLLHPADDRIAFVAADRLGNETRGTIVLEDSQAAGPSGEFAAANTSHRPPIRPLLAALDSDLPAPGGQSGRNDRPSSRPLQLAASSLNEIRWKLGQKLSAALDTEPPIIRLDGLAETQTVYFDRIQVSGNVSDDSQVQAIEVNGVALHFTPGRDVFFSSVLPLADGPNEIRISSTDLTGKRADRSVKIERKRPAIEDPNIRLAVAALPFREGEAMSDLSPVLQGFLVDGLVEQRRYRIVDRETLEQVLHEKELVMSDLVDPDYAIDVSRATPAEAFLVGRAYRRAGSLEAWVKIVDTETSEDLVIEDVYSERAETVDLKPLMSALAQKLALAIPALETPVTRVDGSEVTIAKGKPDRLVANIRVALFRRGAEIENLMGGPPLGFSFTELARGRVRAVTDDKSAASITKGSDALDPMAGDLLVVR